MTLIITKPDRRKGLRAMQDISPETFEKMTPESQMRVMYDLQSATYNLLSSHMPVCNERFKCIENGQRKWKLFSGTVAAGGGLVGGALVMIGKLKFW